jgi:redox-regulated HSP33 family molecular chaperone
MLDVPCGKLASGAPQQVRAHQGRICMDECHRVLQLIPEAERASMRDEGGLISVDCQFCSRIFGIAA